MALGKVIEYDRFESWSKQHYSSVYISYTW